MSNEIYNPFVDDVDQDNQLVFGLSDAVNDENSTDGNNESKPWERNRSDEEIADLNRRAAAGELLPGRKRRRSAYSRRDVTEKDLQLLTFLAHFKYATDGPLATFANVQRRTVYRRMMGLREMKLVQLADVPGARRLWVVSNKGRRVLEDSQRIYEGEVRRMRPDEISIEHVGHNLAIAQTAAWLTRGMPEFESRQKWAGIPYALSTLTSEFKVRQGWDRLMSANNEKLKVERDGKRLYTHGGIGAKYKAAQFRRADEGKIAHSELYEDEPSLWTLSNATHVDDDTKEFHYPDLVLNREAVRDSSAPKSIALEIELSVKNKGELAKIMRMYKADRKTYIACVWVVSTPRIKRHVETVLKQLGLDDSPRFIIVPLFDSFGEQHQGEPWRL